MADSRVTPNITFLLTVEGVDISYATFLDVRISVGRKDVWSNVEAGTLSATLLIRSVGAEGALALGKRCVLTASGLGFTIVLFTGWLTDIDAKADRWGWWEHSISAVGPLAEFTRVEVTNFGWPTETDSQRIARILQTVGKSTELIPDIDGPMIIPSDPEEAAKDWVESEIAKVAASGGGLIYEDHERGLIGYQPSLQRFEGQTLIWDLADMTWDELTATWENPVGPMTLEDWFIPSEAVLYDPFAWQQHAGDLIKYCEVTYGVQGDSDRPFVSAGSLTVPIYSSNIDTVLNDEWDAQGLADRVAFVRGVPRWNAPITILRVDLLEDIGDFFNERLIPGRPVVINTLPPGSPFANFNGFLEGWEHRISVEDEKLIWECELWLSDRALTAPMTTWDLMTASWDSVSDPWNSATIS